MLYIKLLTVCLEESRVLQLIISHSLIHKMCWQCNLISGCLYQNYFGYISLCKYCTEKLIWKIQKCYDLFFGKRIYWYSRGLDHWWNDICNCVDTLFVLNKSERSLPFGWQGSYCWVSFHLTWFLSGENLKCTITKRIYALHINNLSNFVEEAQESD